MTLTEFKNTSPLPGQLSLLRDEFDDVKAITIHRTDCSLSAYDSSLSQLTGLTINIGLGTTVTVNSTIRYGSYYYLEIDNFTFSETVNEEVCVDISLDPFNENISIDFRNSVFNPTFNNVPENLTAIAQQQLYRGKEEMRRGKNIYDVDRKQDAIVPTNINQILVDSANLAEFPESNYHSLANTTGRYIGSKTSVADYGTNPLLGLIQVDASLFNSNITTATICSQSVSDLTITETSFDSSFNTKPNANLLPTASIGNPDGFINGTTSSAAYISNTQTIMEFTYYNEDIDKLKPGAIVHLTNNTKVDYVQVVSVEEIGPQVGWNRTIFRVEVLRGIDGTSTEMTGVYNAPGSGQYQVISIRTVDSDTVYTYEGSKPITISNKKIYFPGSGEIYKVGPRGRLLYSEGECN